MSIQDHFENVLLPMLKASEFVAVLISSDKIDVKVSIEIGAAILLDKPIIAIVVPGTKVSESLCKIVTRFVEFDRANPVASGRALGEVLVELQKSRARFKSIALWPESVNTGKTPNESEDFHESEETAQAVCRLLERDGFGGEGGIFPISTRVQPIDPRDSE